MAVCDLSPAAWLSIVLAIKIIRSLTVCVSFIPKNSQSYLLTTYPSQLLYHGSIATAKSHVDFAVSGSLFGKECKDWYQNLWQREEVPMPLNPATSGQQLCRETLESRTDHEKKCHSQLEAHGEFRWLGYYPQGHVHTRDSIQKLPPTLLIPTSQRPAEEPTSSFSLYRY